ncbi:uncharacterized protein M437DRAFT_62073 [Aureobasidium melanogenum CBS 110374]|uniref:Uncharacterized protein n=1 Tax=Aureobasidium melanogenum (strain CBS 110374) TaxID=1043003 RepID=A0A074WCS6_AURM1|nr:uncharacterized protein M437DRAFT_62073 [Aureobasidium melanogenum CBS 110374]KEQ67692.1 hypothetical protein M437DRAFT_62073 [Aureobasidium melanogenum CBS 110374]
MYAESQTLMVDVDQSVPADCPGLDPGTPDLLNTRGPHLLVSRAHLRRNQAWPTMTTINTIEPIATIPYFPLRPSLPTATILTDRDHIYPLRPQVPSATISLLLPRIKTFIQ